MFSLKDFANFEECVFCKDLARSLQGMHSFSTRECIDVLLERSGKNRVASDKTQLPQIIQNIVTVSVQKFRNQFFSGSIKV